MLSIFRQILLPIFLLSSIWLGSCAVAPIIKNEKMDLAIEEKALRQISLSPSSDEKYIMTGSYKTNYSLWNISDGKSLISETLDTSNNNSNYMHVFLTANNKYAVFTYYDSGEVIAVVRELKSGREIKRVAIRTPFAFVMSALPTDLWSASFSSNGMYLLIGILNSLFIYDLDNSKFIELQSPLVEPFSNPFTLKGILAVAFSKDDKFALSGGQGKIIKLWEVKTGNKIREFNNSSWIYSVAFSEDSTYIAAGGYDETIKLWNAKTGVLEKEFRGHTKIVSAVNFSSDGRYIISGSFDSSVRIWDVASGKEVKAFHFANGTINTMGSLFSSHHEIMVHSVSFSQNGQYFYATIGGTLKIVRADTGEEVASFISFENGEWIVITPEGYYNSSLNAHKFISVNLKNNSDSRATTAYTMENFYDVFYRPDIVAAKLKGEDISGLITLTIDDAIKTPPPSIEFTTVPTDTNQPKTKVCYKIKSTGGGIGEVRLFHNGKLIQSDGYYRDLAKSSIANPQLASLDGKAIYIDLRSIIIEGTDEVISPIASKSKGEVFDNCSEVDTTSGENEVSVTAFNSNNTMQSYMKTISFISKLPPEEPHLYILSIGIDHYEDKNVTLKYAVKDAGDMKEKLVKQAKTLYKSQNIHYELLTDEEASKTNIINKINELAKVIKPGDGFVMFVAGHGILLQSQYFMLTNDFNGTVDDKRMISSNEIVEMSKNIKALNQLMIFDTCHAGGVDNIVSGLYDARMSVLAKKMGLHIYASANSIQEAMDGYKGNGLFTYALLDGLNNNKDADKNQDKNVSLVELGEYSKLNTVNISKRIGHSQTPLIINFGKDNALYNLAE